MPGWCVLSTVKACPHYSRMSISMLRNQCRQCIGMSGATFLSINILLVFIKKCRSTNCNQDIRWLALTAYTEFFNIFLRQVYKFGQENLYATDNYSKLENNSATKHFKKSVTLASRFTERSTFNIEVRHVLFITYFVAIKSYKKKII